MYASKYLKESDKHYIRMNPDSEYVFTNIYTDTIKLDPNELLGLGEISLVIDPIILK